MSQKNRNLKSGKSRGQVQAWLQFDDPADKKAWDIFQHYRKQNIPQRTIVVHALHSLNGDIVEAPSSLKQVTNELRKLKATIIESHEALASMIEALQGMDLGEYRHAETGKTLEDDLLGKKVSAKVIQQLKSQSAGATFDDD